METLLVDVVADGFTLYCCGPKAVPNALVASYEWHNYVDLLTIRDFDRITTARVPAPGRKVDLFAPEFVVWAYEGPPLRALHNLVHPAHPDAPAVEYSAPAGLHVPRAQQRPMTIQLPAPHRAGVRAARLATAMTDHGSHRAMFLPSRHKIPGRSPVESEPPPTLDSRRPAGSTPAPRDGR
ncbi:MAG: hypothetical protein ACRDRX_27415 [Pseudonocardiaceae bacterium]